MSTIERPSLEDQIAETNMGFFLKEFSFSKTEIKVDKRGEIELADHIIFIDDLLFIFQLKERTEEADTSEQESNWYRKKIIGKATKQIRDTIEFIGANSVALTNELGQAMVLPDGSSNYRVLKAIVYSPGKLLPEDLLRKKYHFSSNANLPGGFIHLLQASDYRGILHTLVTFPEILDYFAYREKLCLRFPTEIDAISEQALVGHYIRGDESRIPNEEDTQLLAMLGDSDEFEILAILQKFKEKTYTIKTENGPAEQLDYYKILKELFYLNRTYLKAFKERFMWAWDKCGGGIEVPSRFLVPDRKCGFIFIPIPEGQEYRSELILNNFTILAKYESKYSRYIGIAFRKDGEYRLVDWMYIEGEWEENAEFEAKLKVIPFRDLNHVRKPTY